MNTTIRLKTGLIAFTLALAACGAESSATEPEQELPTLETDTGSGQEDNNTANTDTANTEDGEGNDKAEDVDPEQVMAEFEACMAEFGVDIGIAGASDGAEIEAIQPDSSEEGISTAEIDEGVLEEATKKCDPILDEAFGEFELTPEQEAEFADQMLEMSKCLSARGFEIELDGEVFGLPEDVDFDAFEEAMNECQPDSFGGPVEAGSE